METSPILKSKQKTKILTLDSY